MRSWIVLLVIAVSLAGCGDDEPKLSTANDGHHVHGEYYTCPDGTELDPGSFPDHHDPDFDVSTKCPAAGEPAAVNIDIPSGATAYDTVTLTWDVSPAMGEAKVKVTQLYVSETSALPSESGDYGVRVASQSNKAVPDTFTTEWQPQAPGTYYFRAYASFDDGDVWSDEQSMVVAEIPETGVVHTIKITGAGPLAALEDGTVTLNAGDAIRFQNDDVVAHTFRTGEDAPDDFAITVQGRQSSDAVPLFRLGDYDYTDPDAGFSGTITIELAA